MASRIYEYLYWLSFSKDFREKQRAILENYFKDSGNPTEGPRMIEALIDYYEIPKTPEYLQTLFCKFIFDQSNTQLYPLQMQRIDAGLKTEIQVTGPALAIIIYDKLTYAEFRKLWTKIERAQTGKAFEQITPNFKMLFKKQKKLTKKPYFDRDFNWYKLRSKYGYTYQEIIKKETGRKQHLSEDTVRKAVDSIQEILSAL